MVISIRKLQLFVHICGMLADSNPYEGQRRFSRPAPETPDRSVSFAEFRSAQTYRNENSNILV